MNELLGYIPCHAVENILKKGYKHVLEEIFQHSLLNKLFLFILIRGDDIEFPIYKHWFLSIVDLFNKLIIITYSLMS